MILGLNGQQILIVHKLDLKKNWIFLWRLYKDKKGRRWQ